MLMRSGIERRASRKASEKIEYGHKKSWLTTFRQGSLRVVHGHGADRSAFSSARSCICATTRVECKGCPGTLRKACHGTGQRGLSQRLTVQQGIQPFLRNRAHQGHLGIAARDWTVGLTPAFTPGREYP